MKRRIALFVFLSTCFISFSQEPATIKVKKSNNDVYFFPKDSNTDTIVKDKSDLFYLVVDNRIKPKTTIYIENGTFTKTDNDSIFKLSYVNGISYECGFTKEIKEVKKGEAVYIYQLKSQINGVSGQPKNEILIYFKYENEVKPFIQNRFYYRN